jgi:hypothetical protein
VLGEARRQQKDQEGTALPTPRAVNLPFLSKQVTVGRNSRFLNMTSADREALGGLEYRALKLLLKIAAGKLSSLWTMGLLR